MKLNKRIATATAVAATEIEFRAVAERNMLLTVLFSQSLSLFFSRCIFNCYLETDSIFECKLCAFFSFIDSFIYKANRSRSNERMLIRCLGDAIECIL